MTGTPTPLSRSILRRFFFQPAIKRQIAAASLVVFMWLQPVMGWFSDRVGRRPLLIGFAAIGAVFKAELFPAEIRALGVGLPYAIVVSLFGGTAEYIALCLKQVG